ncbi:hypothetical protein CC86DRAFT_13650 [Ophiobolus disseminans]|uniref:Uncharacterized protein n=1 Tax=Ophiobolus disseminans TaxID=1469910 RepID=A0A6A7ALX9_9PLEO|nr:hypothetical protein CC86DRAFT_13650 [Ophiobolus disseminans]
MRQRRESRWSLSSPHSQYRRRRQLLPPAWDGSLRPTALAIVIKRWFGAARPSAPVVDNYAHQGRSSGCQAGINGVLDRARRAGGVDLSSPQCAADACWRRLKAAAVGCTFPHTAQASD